MNMVRLSEGAISKKLPPLEALASIPEELLWLANFTSAHTRSAYKAAVTDFIERAGLRSAGDFRCVSRAAVIAWRDALLRAHSEAAEPCSGAANEVVELRVGDRLARAAQRSPPAVARGEPAVEEVFAGVEGLHGRPSEES